MSWRKLGLVYKTFGLTIVGRKHYTSVLRTHNCGLHNSWTFLLCVVSSFEISFLTSLLVIVLQRWEFCANATTVMYSCCTLHKFFFFRNAPAKFAERPWHFLCEGAERKSNFQCSIRLIFRTDWKDQLGNKLGSKTSVYLPKPSQVLLWKVITFAKMPCSQKITLIF